MLHHRVSNFSTLTSQTPTIPEDSNTSAILTLDLLSLTEHCDSFTYIACGVSFDDWKHD